MVHKNMYQSKVKTKVKQYDRLVVAFTYDCTTEIKEGTYQPQCLNV